jgi:hypothetical protein
MDADETPAANSYKDLKKSDLEVALDEHLTENASQFSSDPKFSAYYNGRTRAPGSPIKKEAPELKVSRRRATRAPEEVVAAPE